MKALEPHPWKLMFETREDEDHCDIVVHLDAGDRSLSGHGRSKRNPSDPAAPADRRGTRCGSRLQDLARHLTDDAWTMIEQHMQKPAG